MNELLPCPFCGRKAELRHNKDGFSYVLCANDGCYVRTDGCLNDNAAIDLWNTRKPTENVLDELEQLRLKEYDDSEEEPEYMDCEEAYEDGRSQGRYEAFRKTIEIVKGGK